MVQLQHRSRRDGGVSVGKTRYDLDDRGVVEVSEEHAKKMLQGQAWRVVAKEGVMPWPEAPPSPPMVQGAAGRRARTREELLGLAGTQGIQPREGPAAFDQRGRTVKPPEDEESDSAAQEATQEATAPPAEEETIEVSMDMTKAQLVEVCGRLEIEVPKSVTKAQLLDLIRQQSGD
jgi:hypothetical protein